MPWPLLYTRYFFVGTILCSLHYRLSSCLAIQIRFHVLWLAKVCYCCDGAALAIQFFNGFISLVCVWQNLSFTHVSHILQNLLLIECWLGHLYVDCLWGWRSPFTTYGHICFPMEVVMSDNVIACRLILHLLSCLSSFFFLYLFANFSIMYLSLILCGGGINSFYMWSFPSKSIRV